MIDYIEPLRIMKSLVKINTEQFVIWRAFQWHWELLADLIEYLPKTWTKYKVRLIEFHSERFRFFLNRISLLNKLYYLQQPLMKFCNQIQQMIIIQGNINNSSRNQIMFFFLFN